MKYGLSIKNNGSYYAINNYSMLNGFIGLDESKITDIVKFTRTFNNEKELKTFLVSKGILPMDKIDGTFCIHMIKKGNIEEKNYHIFYKNEAHKYLDTLEDNYIRMLSDKTFINMFLTKYMNYLAKSPKLLINLNNIKIYLSNGEGINAISAMHSFIYSYITKKDKSGNRVFQPTKMLELATYLCEYEENKKLNKESVDEDLLYAKHILEEYNKILIETEENFTNTIDISNSNSVSDAQREYNNFLQRR